MNWCVESSKSGAITKALDDVMVAHPRLDPTGHESYNPEVIQQAGDNLMKSILGVPSFPLLDSLRSSDRLKTFKEILASSVDEDEDYLRFKDEGLRSFLNPVDLGLVLAG